MEDEMAAIYGAAGAEALLADGQQEQQALPAATTAIQLGDQPAALGQTTNAAAPPASTGLVTAVEPVPMVTSTTPVKPMVRAAALQQQAQQQQTNLASSLDANAAASRTLASLPQHHPAAADSSIPAYALEDSNPAGQAAAHRGSSASRGAGSGSSRGDWPPGFSPVEVFVGGLPPDAADFDVFLALANAGEVLSVKLFRRQRDKGDCRGYGLAMMASREDAERAVAEVTEACGVRVGVSIPGKSDSFVAVRDAAVVKGPLDLQSPTTVLPATAAAAPKAGGEAQQGAEDGVVKVESEQEGPAAAAGGEGDAGVPEVDGEQQQEEGGQIKPPRPAPPPPEGSMARLLCRVRALGDGKGAAVTAALTTILNIPGLPKLAFPPIVELPEPATEAAELAAREPAAPITAGAAGASGEERAAQQAAETATRGLLPAQPAGAGPGAAAAAGPGPAPDAGFLEKYPRCKSLMEKFPRSRNSPPKTPLQVVHEYATRLSLEVLYDERSESAAGPFFVEAKLAGQRGQHVMATGSGQARSKQQAKQDAAAALLESLLATVPESDLLVSGKAQLGGPRPGIGAAPGGRAGRGGRGSGRDGGRGGGRDSGRGRGRGPPSQYGGRFGGGYGSSGGSGMQQPYEDRGYQQYPGMVGQRSTAEQYGPSYGSSHYQSSAPAPKFTTAGYGAGYEAPAGQYPAGGQQQQQQQQQPQYAGMQQQYGSGKQQYGSSGAQQQQYGGGSTAQQQQYGGGSTAQQQQQQQPYHQPYQQSSAAPGGYSSGSGAAAPYNPYGGPQADSGQKPAGRPAGAAGDAGGYAAPAPQHSQHAQQPQQPQQQQYGGASSGWQAPSGDPARGPYGLQPPQQQQGAPASAYAAAGGGSSYYPPPQGSTYGSEAPPYGTSGYLAGGGQAASGVAGTEAAADGSRRYISNTSGAAGAAGAGGSSGTGAATQQSPYFASEGGGGSGSAAYGAPAPAPAPAAPAHASGSYPHYGASQTPSSGYGSAYGAQPPSSAYGAQPPSSAYGAQPPSGSYGAQPPSSGYAAGGQYGGSSGTYGAPAPASAGAAAPVAADSSGPYNPANPSSGYGPYNPANPSPAYGPPPSSGYGAAAPYSTGQYGGEHAGGTGSAAAAQAQWAAQGAAHQSGAAPPAYDPYASYYRPPY